MPSSTPSAAGCCKPALIAVIAPAFKPPLPRCPAGLPDPPDPADRALRHCRCHRHQRTGAGGQAVATDGPAGGGGKPPRRLGQHRHAVRGAKPAGRLHPAARLRRHHGDQSLRVSQGALRHPQGLRAGDQDGRRGAGAGGASLRAARKTWPNWWPIPGPTPANSPSATPAPAAPPTSRASCSSSAPAWTCRTSPTKAAARQWRIASAGRCLSRIRRWRGRMRYITRPGA